MRTIKVKYVNESGYLKEEEAILKTYKELLKIKNIRCFCSTPDLKYNLYVDNIYNLYAVEQK